MWQIHVEYSSGDSDNHWDESRTIEFEWNDLANAKKALARIREHYEWYDTVHGNSHKNWEYRYGKRVEPKRPEWMEFKIVKWNGKDEEAAIHPGVIVLELDNGNTVQFSAMWCGYFETLKSASIIQTNPNEPDENDMVFIPR